MSAFKLIPAVVRNSLVESVRQASLLDCTIISTYPNHFRLVQMNAAKDRAVITHKVAIVRVGK